MKTSLDILLQAKNRITNVGWHQGWFIKLDEVDQPIGYCILGACVIGEFSKYQKEENDHVTECIEKAIEACGFRTFAPPNSCKLVAFNDATERKVEDVLKVLELAIEFAAEDNAR